MSDLFQQWNTQKRSLHQKSLRKPWPGPFPKEREVWVASLGYNIGREMNGRGKDFSRPLLVLKRFNMQMVWVVPLSSIQKELSFYHNFTDPEGRDVSAVLAQIRMISSSRLRRKLYVLPEPEFLALQMKLRRYLDPIQ